MTIVDYVGDNSERFSELMSIFLEGEYRLTQRSSWAVNYCVQCHPELVKPYLRKLIRLLDLRDGHDAIRRNVTRLLQFVEIPANLRGRVFSSCYDLVDDPRQPVALRVFALTVSSKIATKDQDLMNELRLLTNKHLPHSTAGFRARARLVLG